MTASSYSLNELPQLIGRELGTSHWLDVDQSRIDAFAQVTGDHQWIHVDVQRAKAGPFGSTIAHGYLTLSLLPCMVASAFSLRDSRMGVNYGLNRVRFPAPVPAGSRLRGHFTLLACDAIEGGVQLIIEAKIELEGSDKPACVAELVARRYG